MLYEYLIYDKEYFYKKLAEIFNIDYLIIKKSIELKKENITSKTNEGYLLPKNITIVSLLTQLFRYFAKSHFNKQTYKKLKIIYNTYFPKRLLNKKIKKKTLIRPLNKEENETIFNRFNESNKRLAEIAGLDKNKMNEYKYI